MPKHIVRLLSGSLTESETKKLSDSIIEKPVMLVYAGKFMSMDGEVDITDQHIEKLAENHNGLLSKLSRLATGEVPLKDCPPIQLDHSVSARDTVGRLVGDLTIGEHLEGEEKRKALYGRLRVMGKENVEKVEDGRWTHVSIGADLEAGKLTELSITPFPAAPSAAMLASKRNEELARLAKTKVDPNMIETAEVVRVFDQYGYAVYAGSHKGKKGFFVYDDATDDILPYMFDSFQEAEKYCKGAKMSALTSGRVVHHGKYSGKDFFVVVSGGKFYIEVPEVSSETHGPFKDVFAAKKAAQDMIDDTADLSQGEPKGQRMTRMANWTGRGAGQWVLESNGYSVYVSAEDTRRSGAAVFHAEVQRGAQSIAKKTFRYPVEKSDDAWEAIESWAKTHGVKLSQGEPQMKEKMKKYLMEQKNMSEEDADKHLAALSDDDKAKLATEASDHEKKMKAEEDEEKKKLAAEEDEKKKAEMTAAKTAITKLAGEIKTGSTAVKLAQRKVSISARLSKLKAAAKVTPAEIKKINLSELAGKADEALELYFKGFEEREPQVLTGMYGDRNAAEGGDVARKKRLASMEKTVLEGMPFLSQVKNARLAEGEQEGGEDTVNIHVDTDPHTDMDAGAMEIEKMMDVDPGKAKEMLREYCKKMKGRMTGGGTDEMTEGGEKAVEELASEMKKMQTQNEELLGLIAKLTGETV